MTLTSDRLEDHYVDLISRGWRFHSNYDPREQGSLEKVLNIFPAYLAHEILIRKEAYDLFGHKVPSNYAVFYKDVRVPK